MLVLLEKTRILVSAPEVSTQEILILLPQVFPSLSVVYCLMTDVLEVAEVPVQTKMLSTLVPVKVYLCDNVQHHETVTDDL